MADAEVVLRAQWQALRDWVGGGAVLARLERPSVLAGWTVGELVAHLARAFITAEWTVNDPDASPLRFGAYVGGYGPAATQIAEATRELAVEIGPDLLAGLDELSARGFRRLAELTAPVVRGPRGPITRDDFVLTRLLEAVVHADDLARSLPEIDPPVLLDEAVALVSAALAQAYADAVGHAPDHPAGLDWIRLAAGRVSTDDPHLPLL